MSNSDWGMDENRIGGESVLPPVYTDEELRQLDPAALMGHCQTLQQLCMQLDGDCKFLSWELKESSEILLRFARVTQIAHYLNASDLESIANLAINELPQYLNCQFAAFYLFNPTASTFELNRASHPIPEGEMVRRDSDTGGFLYRFFTCNDEPYIIERTDDGYVVNSGSDDAPEVRVEDPVWRELLGETAIVFPLSISRSEEAQLRLGGLILGNSLVRLSDRDAEVSHMFVDLLSSSLYNAQLVRQLNQMATTDVLTRLYNRRQFLVELDKALAQTQRNPHPLSLAVLDIDHFKIFNDTHGHHCGDLVLREMGSILSESLRKNVDVPARYGGEEFTIIMPYTMLDQAVAVAERIRIEVENRSVVYGESRLSVTCSLGVAEYRPGDTASSLIDRADTALYHAKNSGRNRVSSIADDLPAGKLA
ncbi:MAG: GGDEF domain-containing protein [Planctomycetota bacterium]|nr:GGDEF domain-containing protein [Planctomycetota bacterium]